METLSSGCRIALLILSVLFTQVRRLINRMSRGGRCRMMTFVLLISLLANAFTLFVLKQIVGYYSRKVGALEEEVRWVSLEVRALR